MNMKKFLTVGVALALCVSLAGCSSVKTAVTNLLFGAEQQESTTVDVYAEPGGSITFPEGFDATESRLTTTIQDGTLYIGFNGIQIRNTGYFEVSGSTLTLTSYATTESQGLLEYKAGLWMLDENNNTEYVNGCTLYFTTGGDCYTGTFTGLDPSRKYKLTISYDSFLYYITGAMKVEGLAGDHLEEVEGAEG